MKELVNKFKKELASIIDPGQKSLLIAFSGGKDSMTLLNLLLEIKEEFALSLSIAYINHNLRGNESDQEEIFIKKYAKELKLPLYIYRVQEHEWQKKQNSSIEMTARTIRYCFFKKIAREKKIDYIATAHNFNDRIETFFLNIFRGSGTETLTSIPVKNKNIIRPLLNFNRQEIDAYICDHHLKYIHDSTNDKNIFQRNIIRNQLLPIFSQIHSHYQKSFAHLFQMLEEDKQLKKRITLSYLKKIMIYKNRSLFCLDLIQFQKLSIIIKKNIIKVILKHLNYPALPDKQLLNYLSKSKGRLKYQKQNFICQSRSSYLWLINQLKIKAINPKTIDHFPIHLKNKHFSILITSKKVIDNKKSIILKYDDRLFPLKIRAIDKIDTIKILNSNKKIIDILKKNKIPPLLFKAGIVIETDDHKVIAFCLYNLFRVATDYYVGRNETGLNIKFIF